MLLCHIEFPLREINKGTSYLILSTVAIYTQVLYTIVLHVSVLTFPMIAWYGNLNNRGKNHPCCIVKVAGEVIVVPQTMAIFNQQVLCKATSISDFTDHSLHFEFETLPSGCTSTVPRFKCSRSRHPFVPCAVVFISCP